MRKYTVAQLRENMKEALDAVTQGEEVIVNRLGQTFVIAKWRSEEVLAHHVIPGTMSTETARRIQKNPTKAHKVDWCKQHDCEKEICKMMKH